MKFTIVGIIAIVFSGVLCGIDAIALSLSFAAIVYSGPLSPYLETGVAITLFGSIAVALVVTLTSSVRGMVASAQDVPAVVLALIVGSIATHPKLQSSSSDVLLSTAVMTVVVSTFLFGIVSWMLGKFRSGRLIRFMPYPVIGGFLATTGWLLLSSGIETMTGRSFQWGDLGSYFQSEVFRVWAPAMAIGLLLFVGTRIYKHSLSLPVLLLIIGAGSMMLLQKTGLDTDALVAQGLVFNLRDGVSPEFVLFDVLANTDWLILLSQLPVITALVIVCVASTLLNASGIELQVRQPVELNQELQSAGGANMLASVFGGMPGYQLVGTTSIVHAIGAKSRLVGIIAALIIATPFIQDLDILTKLPKSLFGGLLIFLGLQLLYEWLWKARLKFSYSDILIVWIILVSSILLGVFQGIGAGVLVSLVVFFVRYIKTSVIMNVFSGADLSSRRERTRTEKLWLREHGGAVHIVQLCGYIFFGTAQQILTNWQKRLEDASLPSLKYVVYDFRLVTGVDSSVIFSLKRLVQFATHHKVTIIACAVPERIEALISAEFDESEIRLAATRDASIEYCESDFLSDLTRDPNEGFAGQLKTYLKDPDALTNILRYCKRQHYSAGDYLIRQDDVGDDMLVLESGQITITLHQGGASALRLRTMGPGSVLGELALFGSEQRSASIVADTDAIALWLSRDSIRQMEKEAPELTRSLYRAMSSLLADRLLDSMALVRALSR